MFAARTTTSQSALFAALSLVGALALAGCQQVVYGGDDTDSPPPPDIPWWEDEDDDGNLDEADGNPSTTTTGASTTDDPPGKLDFPGDGTTPLECKIVDLLFVIDNSGSMAAEQQSLIASFDGFIAGIQDNLDETNDTHIGVVTTDAYAANSPGCQELGALVDHNEGGPCGPWAEGRYISLSDPLEQAFTCAADVGIEGNDDERPLAAALRALSPELAGPGGCNEGFVRDDALLVLVLITDEDDGGSGLPDKPGSPGDPPDWFAELVELRGGVESNIVVLALAGVLAPNACDPLVPGEGAQLATRIGNFVDKFTYGEIGDVCVDDYTGFFAASLETIRDACISFTPVE